MSSLERITGTIAGAAPFLATVCLDKGWQWGVGTALWGLAVIIMIGTETKPQG
jgi:uncharacterized membrane protein (UPF0136 family)